jgi:hypothetical protein
MAPNGQTTYFTLGMDDIQAHLAIHAQQRLFDHNLLPVSWAVKFPSKYESNNVLRKFAQASCYILFSHNSSNKLVAEQSGPFRCERDDHAPRCKPIKSVYSYNSALRNEAALIEGQWTHCMEWEYQNLS